MPINVPRRQNYTSPARFSLFVTEYTRNTRDPLPRREACSRVSSPPSRIPQRGILHPRFRELVYENAKVVELNVDRFIDGEPNHPCQGSRRVNDRNVRSSRGHVMRGEKKTASVIQFCEIAYPRVAAVKAPTGRRGRSGSRDALESDAVSRRGSGRRGRRVK